MKEWPQSVVRQRQVEAKFARGMWRAFCRQAPDPLRLEGSQAMREPPAPKGLPGDEGEGAESE